MLCTLALRKTAFRPSNAVASQLARNERYENVNRTSSRLVSEEMSNLRRATTSSLVNISGNFTSIEFTIAL